MRLALPALALALALGAATARAAPAWLEDGKAGRFALNLRLGGSLPVRADIAAGVAGLELGIALTADRAAYLVVPVEVGASRSAATINLGLGFQYDLRLPVRGLYLAPRVAGGYAAVVPYSVGTTNAVSVTVIHAAWVAPEIALKLVISRRWNLGVVPASFPIFFARDDTGATLTRVAFRALVFAGVGF